MCVCACVRTHVRAKGSLHTLAALVNVEQEKNNKWLTALVTATQEAEQRGSACVTLQMSMVFFFTFSKSAIWWVRKERVVEIESVREKRADLRNKVKKWRQIQKKGKAMGPK